MTSTSQLTIAALLLATTLGASAETITVSESITVEAAELLALEERKESPIDRTIITRREMEELGGQTAADVLRRLPRMFFSGPLATNKDVRMAGLDKEFQSVLINGNRPPGGGEKREFALDRIPVEQIERIEILESAPASMDSDAIGGIVNIILKDAPKQRSFNATLSSGFSSADEIGSKISAHYGDVAGQLSYGVGGTLLDDYRTKGKQVVDSAKGEGQSEDELARTLTTLVDAALSFRPTDRDVVSFHPFYSVQDETKEKKRLVTALSSELPISMNDEIEEKQSSLQSYALEWTRDFVRGGSLEIGGLFQALDETKDKVTEQYKGEDLSYAKDLLEQEEKQDEESLLSADLVLPFAGRNRSFHILSTGVKFRDKTRTVEKTKQEVSPSGVVKDKTNPAESYSVNETIAAIYVMDEATLSTRFVVTPGVRVEFIDGTYATAAGAEDDDQSVDFNPSVHARYRLNHGVQLRGAVARVIARPPFKDKVPTRTVKRDKIELGNPELKAASSLNVDFGVEWYFGSGGLMALGAFWKGIDDVVERLETGIDEETGLPVIMPVNAGRGKVWGTEIELRSDLGLIGLPQMTLIGNYTRLSSEVEDVNTGETRRLADQPKALANLLLRYDLRPFGMTISAGYNYIGEKVNGSNPTKGTKVEKPLGQWDMSITKTITNRFSLYASGVNLTNETKQKTEGSRIEKEQTGRTFQIGMRYSLR